MFGLVAAVSLVVFQNAELDESDSAVQAQKQKWDEFYRAEAASYKILLDTNEQKLLTLQSEPVLLWSNPLRPGETNGSVFVWTYEGRPELVGTIFSHLSRTYPDKRHIAHSFHSLSLQPITAKRGRKTEWSFTVAGIKPEKIPGAAIPANTRALRLTQMRDLAREFSAVTILGGVEQELRLLPQPLYRYAQSSSNVIDGALFTFVTGTDPELMLVIEARGADDNAIWHFGAGRFTDLELIVKHKDSKIWTYEAGLVDDQQTPYLSRRTELKSRTLP